MIAAGDEFYLKAFYELSTCRQIGMGLGPIPWLAIMEYVAYAGLETYLIEHFTRIIRAMDKAYLKWEQTETERKTKASKSQSKQVKN